MSTHDTRYDEYHAPTDATGTTDSTDPTDVRDSSDGSDSRDTTDTADGVGTPDADGRDGGYPVDGDRSRDLTTDDGAVLLPRDADEPTDGSPTAPDSAPVTVVDGDPVTDLAARQDRYDADYREIEQVDPTVGPDTESGALKDPVPDGVYDPDRIRGEGFDPTPPDTAPTDTSSTDVPGGVPATGAASTDVPSTDVPSTDVPSTDVPGTDVPSTDVAAPFVTDDEWRELQGRFVDDPAGAVRAAGEKVENAVAELRSRIEQGSTEDLRTAFRRYRDLFTALG